MSIRFYLILSTVLCLPGCFFSNGENTAVKHTYFVQALFDSAILTSIKEAITPIVNHIVKEELGLEKEYDFEFFLPKKRQPQALTIYYVDDMYTNGETFLFSALENIQKRDHLMPKNVKIKSEVNFFGDQEDELVVMIDDPAKELFVLNQETKKAVNHANEEYKSIHKHNLYDVAKSERFPYVPHVGLGRIRSNSIKERIKDSSQIAYVFEHIKQRIKKEVLQVLKF